MSLAPLDLENSSGALNQPKVIYAGDAYQGQPYIVVTEDNIILVGDANTVVRPGPSRPAHILRPAPARGPAGSSSIEAQLPGQQLLRPDHPAANAQFRSPSASAIRSPPGAPHAAVI